MEYRKAEIKDAQRLVEIYNSAFYDDYIRYGECPAYGRTKEMMEQSIRDYPKFLIIHNDDAVGCISCKEFEEGTYEVGCLDKEENVRFYTQKCGFDIQEVEMDGNVKVYRFILER